MVPAAAWGESTTPTSPKKANGPISFQNMRTDTIVAIQIGSGSDSAVNTSSRIIHPHQRTAVANGILRPIPSASTHRRCTAEDTPITRHRPTSKVAAISPTIATPPTNSITAGPMPPAVARSTTSPHHCHAAEDTPITRHRMIPTITTPTTTSTTPPSTSTTTTGAVPVRPRPSAYPRPRRSGT